MKKTTLQYLVDLMNYEIRQNGGEANTDTMYVEVRDELTAELNRGAEKAQANRDLYASAKDTILGALSDTPVTVAELYDEIKSALPEGFTKSKVQYALTHYWKAEVTRTLSNPNTYSAKK